ncbi:MAG: S8 family serine peptidase [Planctomycetota bacterium]|jgi:subtilisin family serine protease|nr:S8 family serine peptidase [Planctomycetota bacterium]
MVSLPLGIFVACLCPGTASDKLDTGLEGDRYHAVFVRMADQLFPRGGDFERFCRENKAAKRSELRARVTKTLRDKNDTSWKAIRKQVDALVKEQTLSGVQRTWIVNGFFCRAKPSACKALATRDDVAFVYRQRALIQTGGARNRNRRAPDRKLLNRLLGEWKDDSDDAFSASDLKVPWNLKRIRVPEAWKLATGRGAVVATFDTGLYPTPALVGALWRNPTEQVDGKDNDGNGKVDDVFGWDFSGNHNVSVGDARGHGTACGGIIAGRPAGEPRTVTGVAPRARIMPIRGMGHLAAYEYAVLTGADVVSMSYMWIRVKLGHYRGLYRLAHEHMTAAGVVSVGGAGNFKQQAPKGHQIALPKDIPCVIAVAGIFQNGKQAPFSSEGPCYWNGVKFYDDYPPDQPLVKPDVTACPGGYPVWFPKVLRRRSGQRAFRGRVVWDAGDGCGLVVGPRGNSFSGPHAAGVAALMLSANPELPAWRVKELMEATCKDLGEEGRDTTYGAGLIQADAAVRAAIDAKQIDK